jgi:CubicO group peptidase (beta-lactamase class C family)
VYNQGEITGNIWMTEIRRSPVSLPRKVCMRMTLRLVLTIAVLCPAAAAAQPADVEAGVDAVFARFTAQTPGCAVGVVRDGVLVHAKGYGQASVELGVPITPATVFDIGSVSKQITAASIVLLAQQGKLALDDDLRKFVPEIPDYGQKITLRHLLHHTSGLRDYIGLLTLAGAQEESVTTDADALAAIVRQKGVNFAPGDDYLYSNTGYFLLSLVVRKASGKPLREFAQEHIFGPLDMKHTQILDDHTKVIAGKAASYAPKRDGGFRNVTSNWEQTGDGAVQTTIGDLAKWDANFYNGRVGGAALGRELETTGLLNDGAAIDYALGLTVDQYRGLRRIAHGGSWAGFRSYTVRFPDQKVSTFVLCNRADGDPGTLATKAAERYLEKAMTPLPAPSPAKPSIVAESVAGTYYSRTTMTVRRFTARNGQLFAGSEPGQIVEPVGGSQYRAASGAELRFENSGLVVVPTTGKSDRFERVTEPAPAAFSKFAGDYWSAELGLAVRIVVSDGRLTWHAPEDSLALRFTDAPLGPVTEGVLAGPGFVLAFDKKGFVLGAGRARGMRFVKR